MRGKMNGGGSKMAKKNADVINEWPLMGDAPTMPLNEDIGRNGKKLSKPQLNLA